MRGQRPHNEETLRSRAPAEAGAWWLIGPLLVILGGSIAIRVLAQRASREVDSASDVLVNVSSPAIGTLATLRASVYEIELQLFQTLDTEGVDPEALRDITGPLLQTLDENVQAYLSLPTLEGEQEHRRRIQQTHLRFHDEVVRASELAGLGRREDAQRAFSRRVLPAGGEVIGSAMAAITAHAEYGTELGTRIKSARRRSLILSNVLTAIYVLVLGVGLFLVYREARRRRELVQARADYHEARAAELEQFAGRVAHDIQNPISSARLVAELLQRQAQDDGTRERAERILRSLSRATAITAGLLDFARSGARPEPGARTDVRDAVGEVIASFEQEADAARISLQAEPVPAVRAVCSRGVYLSLLTNLVRNAIKYMGEASTRKIGVRVVVTGDEVRTEVSDTGPGIRPELVPMLFETYFRASGDVRKEGLGLGLATVKKLAEGHGGRVGVRSEVGQGSTFWFSLPRAGNASAAEEVDADRSGPAASPSPDERH